MADRLEDGEEPSGGSDKIAGAVVPELAPVEVRREVTHRT
jgi:hypothetical protein